MDTVNGLLNYKQAASFLGIAESTLRKHVSRRRISHVKVCRCVRFRSKDLNEYLETNAVPAEA